METDQRIKFALTIRESVGERLFGPFRFRREDNISCYQFVPPGSDSDFISVFLFANSIRDMMRIVEKKHGIKILLDISDYEKGFLDTDQAGPRIAKLSSIPYLLEKDIPDWERATGRDALEIILLLLLQVEDKEMVIKLLEPYLNGTVMLCNTNNQSDDYITLEIEKENNIIILKQVSKNEIMTQALRGEKTINSCWLLGKAA